MKKIIALAFALALFPYTVQASTDAIVLPKQDWSFKGPMGTFDRGAAQRGFQVYKEVCAACHSMNQMHYRNLAEIGFSEEQIKAIAAERQVKDGPNDEGEMFERPGRPSDKFVAPFANVQAARAANNGAAPPDLSLMVKARAGGADYVYALLTGYEQAPAHVTVNPGMYYNKYFPGHQIAMAPPLASDGQVGYTDGTNATVAQMAYDVATFMAWTAEPELEERHRTGLRVMIFLAFMAGLFYLSKAKLWRNVK